MLVDVSLVTDYTIRYDRRAGLKSWVWSA